MINYNMIDTILDDLVSYGSTIPYRNKLRNQVIYELKKDLDLNTILNSITDEVCSFSNDYLNNKNVHSTNVISGLSTGIYLPDYSDGKADIVIVGGNKSRENNNKIDFDTVFDMASITKLYTLLLAFRLEELGYINLNSKISCVNSDFKYLDDYTFNDLIKLYGELRTNGRINDASSIEEAYNILKTVFIVDNDRNKIKYNDFGSMIISNTIEKIMSQIMGKEMSFDEIMNEFLFKPLNINNTMYNPKTDNVSGNGYALCTPHDPKVRLFGGVSGHAGLFSNSSDLMKLSDMLFKNNFLNKEHKERLCRRILSNNLRGNMGLFLKDEKGLKVTYNPSELSDYSFTSEGYTGSIASFDLKNKIHNSILVNAIINDEKTKMINDKPVGFMEASDSYQTQLIKNIMLMYVIKKYYNKYLNVKEDIILRRVI